MKQIFYFKQHPIKDFLDNYVLIAQTELGNIEIKDDKLYVPRGPDEVHTYMTVFYVYDFKRRCWLKQRGNVIQTIPDAFVSVKYDNLCVYDLLFFTFICTQSGLDYDSKILLEMKKTALKELRERDCYPIINRGKLWYDRLTYDQLMELDKWYKDWLNVTETLRIPPKLDWVNNKLEEEDIL